MGHQPTLSKQTVIPLLLTELAGSKNGFFGLLFFNNVFSSVLKILPVDQNRSSKFST